MAVNCIECPPSEFQSADEFCQDVIQSVSCGDYKYCQYDNGCLAGKAGFDFTNDCQDGESPWAVCESTGEDREECTCLQTSSTVGAAAKDDGSGVSDPRGSIVFILALLAVCSAHSIFVIYAD